MEAVKVSVATACWRLEGDFTVMLEISLLSPSVPCPPHPLPLSLSLCLCVYVCVLPAGLKKSASNLDPPRAAEQEKEDAAKMFSTKRSAQCHF